jgi:hypothetical protein
VARNRVVNAVPMNPTGAGDGDQRAVLRRGHGRQNHFQPCLR